MVKKHRHKWNLEYVNSTIGKGLIYTCECGECLEFDKKKPNIKEVITLYQKIIDKLNNK